MENNKLQMASEVKPLADSIKAIAQEELTNAFNKELKAYQSFIGEYHKTLQDYHTDFLQFKEDKHITTFLYKNIHLNNQIQEALSKLSDKNEELFLPNAFRTIADKALEFYGSLGTSSESVFFGIIEKTSAFQNQNRSQFEKKAEELLAQVYKKPELDSSETLNSLIYLYFEKSVLDVLKENEPNLNEFYRHFAEISNDLWAEFDLNTFFSQKLDKAKYKYESLEPDDFNWNLVFKAAEKIEVIEKDFQLFVEELILVLENSILDFNISTLYVHKAKVLRKEDLFKSQSKYFDKFEKAKSNWRNTRLALADDWCLDLEISVLKQRIIQEYIDFVNFFTNDFNTPLFKNLDNFESQFNVLNDDFNSETSQSFEENVQEVLRKFKIRLKKELIVKSLPVIRNQLNSTKLIEEIVAFENVAEKSFSSVSKHRQLMKTPDYLREVTNWEIESISLYDLFSFEIKPKFIRVFPAFKIAIIEHTQKLLTALETSPNIAVFSIESAAQHFEENNQPTEVINICREGIKRSLIKVQETKALHEEFIKIEIDKLSSAIDVMVSSMKEITDNESAFRIKMRVAKAKALAQSKEVRDKILAKIKHFLPIVLEKSKVYYQFIQDSSQKFTKQFFYEKSSGFISTDISDFLNTTQSAISKLPYVYKRLFSFEPLKTFELYVKRTAPMDMLNLAFSKWKEEKFSPVVLIGEKGSGKTTFIRKFFKNKASNEEVFFFDLMAENKSPDELYQHILESSRIVNHVKGEKKIIALDGFERLFQSKINGFEYLLKLFKVISETQKDIFWIVSVHSISWLFFDNSIQASNYFGYQVHLNYLQFDELVNLIESRHNLSGYKIIFEDTQRKRGLLGNTPLNPEELQEYLRKTFFTEMNKNVQGNILQTYLYWMRSAELKENNTIYVTSDNKLDFDFVRSIPAQKLLLLRSILIHNGLTTEKLAEIFRVNIFSMELQLIQLSDDGILTNFNNSYFVNPLIYKQLIKHLFNINLLH